MIVNKLWQYKAKHSGMGRQICYFIKEKRTYCWVQISDFCILHTQGMRFQTQLWTAVWLGTISAAIAGNKAEFKA